MVGGNPPHASSSRGGCPCCPPKASLCAPVFGASVCATHRTSISRPRLFAICGSRRRRTDAADRRTHWHSLPAFASPGAAVLSHGEHGLDDVAQVGEAVGRRQSAAAGARRRDRRLDDFPLRIGETARVGGARRLACEASCWRGFLLMTGGGGHPGKEVARPLSPCVEGSVSACGPFRPPLRVARPSLSLSRG